MDKVKLGEITAPVGIKGEVRVYPYVDDIARFFDFKKVLVGETLKEYEIQKLRIDKNMLVVKFTEVNDRNVSEELRGLSLYLPKSEYDLEEDRYFIDDLISCEVYSESGGKIGNLINVIQNTSMQDIYEIKCDGRANVMIPAVKEFIKNVDIDKKIITVHLIEGLLD